MGAAAIVTAAGSAMQGVGSVTSSLFGKKKSYDYNSRLQREQFEQNQKLAEQQNSYNRQLQDRAYQQNIEQWKRENEWNLEQWNRENEWNLEQWNRENAYNSPSAQAARLRAAGYNANLQGVTPGEAGSFSAGSVDSASSPQLNYSDSAAYPVSGTSGVSDYMNNPFAGVSETLQSFFQLSENKRLHDKQFELWDSIIEGKSLDNALKEQSFDYKLKKYGLANENLELTNFEKRFSNENFLYKKLTAMEIANNSAQVNYEQQVANLDFFNRSLDDNLKRINLGNKLLESQIGLNTSNKNLIDAKKEFQLVQNKYAEASITADLNYKYSMTDLNQVRESYQRMKNNIFKALNNPAELSPAEKEYALTLLGLATGNVYQFAGRIGSYINQRFNSKPSNYNYQGIRNFIETGN